MNPLFPALNIPMFEYSLVIPNLFPSNPTIPQNQGFSFASAGTWSITPPKTPALPENGQVALINNQCLWESSGLPCLRIFQNPCELAAHIKEVHVASTTNNVCHWKSCKRKRTPFAKKYKLVIHLQDHTGKIPFKCNVCGKCFSRAGSVRMHQRTHKGEKPYVCSVEGCSKRYRYACDRLRHMKSHTERTPFDCKQCDRKYTWPSSLREHIKMCHQLSPQ